MQKEHEEQLKKSEQYAVDEAYAQNWLHQSFAPKTKILLQKHIKQTIFYCGVLLVLFIFFWSFLVAGLPNALLNVIIALILYAAFVVYVLHIDKWYRYIFKQIPKPYRHFKDNDWIHGYVLLLPFAFVCFMMYVGFNFKNIVTFLVSIPTFILVYTLLFICGYCCYFVYKEYANEEKVRKSYSKKTTEE